MKRARIHGELVENRIVVWDLDQSRLLFQEGFYGKPLGVAKPKGADFNSPLILDLIEGYYLARKDRLRILGAGTGEVVSTKALRVICEKEYVDFEEKFRVYEELREAGFVVTPGIKFGSDFAVYERGPGIDHAPYVVHVVRPSEKITATGVVLSGRLATTVRKQFILALSDAKKESVDFLSFDWWRA